LIMTASSIGRRGPQHRYARPQNVNVPIPPHSLADWHQEVHATIPYDDWIEPNPNLARLLSLARAKKHVFTNADACHAQSCLERLGLHKVIDGVVVNFNSVMHVAEKEGLAKPVRGPGSPLFPLCCKPQKDAFRIALELTGVQGDPATVLFVDDSPRNIAGAHAFGIRTVLIGHREPCRGADFHLPSVEHLPHVMPELFADSPEAASARLRAAGVKVPAWTRAPGHAVGEPAGLVPRASSAVDLAPLGEGHPPRDAVWGEDEDRSLAQR